MIREPLREFPASGRQHAVGHRQELALVAARGAPFLLRRRELQLPVNPLLVVPWSLAAVRLPPRKCEMPFKYGFSGATPKCGMVLWYCGWTFCAHMRMRGKGDSMSEAFDELCRCVRRKIELKIQPASPMAAHAEFILSDSPSELALFRASVCRLWTLPVLLVKSQMPIVHARQLPLDE